MTIPRPSDPVDALWLILEKAETLLERLSDAPPSPLRDEALDGLSFISLTAEHATRGLDEDELR